MDVSYTGYKELKMSDEEMARFYMENSVEDMLENEYLLIKDKDDNVVDKYCYQNGELRRVGIVPISNSFSGTLKPRNPQQVLLFDMLSDTRSEIKLVTGCYGSGKSMAMIDGAISMLEKGKIDKIVFVRNNISVRDTGELGALPGNDFEKLLPYLMPFADHVGGTQALEFMVSKGQLEPIHLGFLRGRDLHNSLIYCTEAQNLTVDHVKLLIGRVGEGSQLWFDGDFKAQTDRPIFEKSPGLYRMTEKLKGNPHFAAVHLVKSERSAVAALADLLD